MKPRTHSIRRRAIRIVQNRKHPLYLFALSADELLQIADISRVARDDAGQLLGYQRPEVKRHVKNIVEYLDSDEVLFPNSVILALSSSCTFKLVRGPKVEAGPTEAGTLEIPLPRDGGARPAWIVDGQQRALALSHAKRRDFPVPINAFIADEVELQRDQFLRVNNTKPLPKGLITELLPAVDTVLPPNLAARKTPSALCDILHRDPESPFFGLIRRASLPPSEKKKTVVTDTALVKVLQDSFGSPSGCLFPYRNSATNVTDFESIKKLLLMYWSAVRDVFPRAWGLPPERSRLMHSVGILAVGRLMDRVMGSVSLRNPKAPAQVRADVARIKSVCRWTEGRWDELDAEWNELQNVPRHVRGLTEFLVRTYLSEEKLRA
jgi:DGQHR domain-containing protein